jgi:perosamine synthetase
VYPRHRLDVRGRDLLHALAACVAARAPGRDAARAARAWGAPAEEAVVCLSVRTGFDLLLEALALPEGSDVLLTAVTHPELPRIARRHGLRPVPVDLDLDTLGPGAHELEQALGPQARVLVVSHLFGARVELDPLVALARRHGLLLVEDCAQSFRGPGDAGDPRAEVTMASFGPIKTCTALGGALLRVRDARVRERMLALQADWPVQRRLAYAARVLKFVGLTLVSHPALFGVLFRLAPRLGIDLDEALVRMVRGFAPAPGEETTAAGRSAFRERFHKRPSAPLIAVLARRLERFDACRLARRADLGADMAARLPATLYHPGRRAHGHTHWVFPVVAAEPERLVSGLRRRGFDASRGTSSIVAVAPPEDRPDLAPRRSAALLAGAVFLPVYPELPERAVAELLTTLAELEREQAPRVAEHAEVEAEPL